MSGKTLAEAGAAFQAAGRPLTLTFHVPSYEAAVWVDGSGLASAEKAEELCARAPSARSAASWSHLAPLALACPAVWLSGAKGGSNGRENAETIVGNWREMAEVHVAEGGRWCWAGLAGACERPNRELVPVLFATQRLIAAGCIVCGRRDIEGTGQGTITVRPTRHARPKSAPQKHVNRQDSRACVWWAQGYERRRMGSNLFVVAADGAPPDA